MGAGRTGRALASSALAGLGGTAATAADDDTAPQPFSFSGQLPTVEIYCLARAGLPRRRAGVLALAIIEDLSAGVSPDVSFTLGLQHGF